MAVLSIMKTLTLLLLAVLLSACERSPAANVASSNSSDERNPMTPTARVRVINKDGKLSDPIDAPKLVLSDAEWQKRLTKEQYRIGRAKGTEPAFCGGLPNNHEEGVYFCVGCNLPLFSSDSKFNSGTGWPSFFQPICKENLHEEVDRAYGMVRTEIICNRCDMHLGHSFDDGPAPTGLRYCLNSEVMKFVPKTKLAGVGEDVVALAAAGKAATRPTTK